MNLAILYQDTGWLAVDKPAGISIHNVEDSENLISLLQKQLNSPRIFPIHRLDKETSGVQLLATNEKQAQIYATEFQDRKVEKIYEAVLRGNLSEDLGTWSMALSDKAEGRKNPAGLADDRVPCETRFKVIKRNKYFTHCEFQLITGRQHQIRKHAALMKHALVGDPRYGDPQYNKKIAEIYKTNRMLLHCSRVKILGETLISPCPFNSFVE